MEEAVIALEQFGQVAGHDYQQCYKLHFESKIKQMEEVLEQVAKRNLTLFGKVCIVKTLAISKIVYVSMCLTVPEKIIKEIDQRILKFLWGKRDRIKRKSIVNKLEDGGLNMIDLRSHISAIKAVWAARIVTAPANHVWSFLPKL